MAENNSVWHWLESAGLERFYNKFRALGINESNFTNLQFSDYDAVGITQHSDRQKMFKLIQVVKRELNSNDSASSDPEPAPKRPTSSKPASKPARAASPESENRRGSARQFSGLRGPKKYESGDEDRKQPSQRPPRASPDPTTSGRPKSAKTVNRSGRPTPSPSPDEDGSRMQWDFDGGANEADILTGSRIRVCIRKRPLSKKEIKKGETDVISFPRHTNQVVNVAEHKQKVDLSKYVEKHEFVFDEAFSEKSTNAEIYNNTCKPLVKFFLNQGKATCFAYGQTGSGKTFTMMGPGGKNAQPGLYALAAKDIFETLDRHPHNKAEVWVSFFEIYGGKLFDLLNERQKLVAREAADKSVHVVGLRETQCKSVSELMDVMEYGGTQRSTGSTGANMDSSRSHAILQIVLKVPEGRRQQKRKKLGQFSFIDLAGSERGADTMANDKRTRIEGAEINRSLLALKECIRALDQQKSHKPFRGSKLTQVLKESFIGNSRTIMIANISPNVSATEHTLNTLRYADRVKELRNDNKAQAVNAYMPHQDHKNVQRFEVEEWEDELYENENPDEDDFLVPINDPAPAPSPEPMTNSPPQNKPQPKPVSGIARPSNGSRQGSRKDMRPASGANKKPVPKSKITKPRPKPKPQSQQQAQPEQPKQSSRASSRVDEDEPDFLDQDEATQDLLRTHQQICSAILEEEEEIVEAHRNQIDNTMKLVKEEMTLLKKFDQLAFSVDDYVTSLDVILEQKIKSISALKQQITTFRAHLKEEELLSASLKGGSLDLLSD